MSLTGSYLYSLDRKGRLVCPAPVREALGEPLIVAPGPVPSAVILSIPHWQAVEAAHGMDPQFRREVLPFVYEEAVCRVTGRVMVRQPLRERNGWKLLQTLGVAGCGPAAMVVDGDWLTRHGAPSLPAWAVDTRPSGVLVPRGTALLALDLLGSVPGRGAEVAEVLRTLEGCCR